MSNQESQSINDLLSPDDGAWIKVEPMPGAAWAFRDNLHKIAADDYAGATDAIRFGQNYLNESDKLPISLPNKFLLLTAFGCFVSEMASKNATVSGYDSLDKEAIVILDEAYNILKDAQKVCLDNNFKIHPDFHFWMSYTLSQLLLDSVDRPRQSADEVNKVLIKATHVLESYSKLPRNPHPYPDDINPIIVYRNCRAYLILTRIYEKAYKSRINYLNNVKQCKRHLYKLADIFLEYYLKDPFVPSRWQNEHDIWFYFKYDRIRNNIYIRSYAGESEKRHKALLEDILRFTRNILHRAANFMCVLGDFERAEKLFEMVLDYKVVEPNYPSNISSKVELSFEYNVRCDLALNVYKNIDIIKAITHLQMLFNDLYNQDISSRLYDAVRLRLPSVVIELSKLLNLIGQSSAAKSELSLAKKIASELKDNKTRENALRYIENLKNPENHKISIDILEKAKYSIETGYPFDMLENFEDLARDLLKKPDEYQKTYHKLISRDKEETNPTKARFRKLLEKVAPSENTKSKEATKLIKQFQSNVDEWVKLYPRELKSIEKYLPPKTAYSDERPRKVFLLLLDLARIIHPARVPRLLLTLAQIQMVCDKNQELNKKYWLSLLGGARHEALNINDFNMLLICYRLLIENEPGRITRSHRKSLIAQAESAIAQIELGSDLTTFQTKSFSSILDAAFGLAENLNGIEQQLNDNNESEWVFRASELFRARLLITARSGLSKSMEPGQKDLSKLLLDEMKMGLRGRRAEVPDEFHEKKASFIEEEIQREGKVAAFHKFGIAWFDPVARTLSKHDTKISVVSLTVDESGKRLLLVGFDNFNFKTPWIRIINLKIKISDLILKCWKYDIPSLHDNQYPALSRLYELILKDIESYFNNTDLIYFVLDGNSLHLPLHAAFNAKEKQFFIQRHRVAYASSARLLSFLLGHERYRVNNLLASCSSIAGGKDFEDDIKEIMRPAGYNQLKSLKNINFNSIVYLSGHGEHRQDIECKFEEHIHASDDPNSEYYMIKNSDFLNPHHKYRAQLIFLNSCLSGKGAPFVMDEFGFKFSIMARGTQTCMLALSEVESKFAQTYARSLLKKIRNEQDLHEAMRDTTLEFINDSKGKYKKPFYWAPYVLIGDYRKIIFE